MGRLRSWPLLVSLCAAGPAAFGRPADDAPAATPAATAPAAPPAARPEPPAAPRKYLEAGAALFNKTQYDLAGQYLKAAHIYRDRLTESERIVLDVYREKLDAVRPPPAAMPMPAPVPLARGVAGDSIKAADPGVVTASAPNVVDAVQALTRPRVDPYGPVFEASSGPFPGPGPAPVSGTASAIIPPVRDAGSPPPPADGMAANTNGSGAWRDTADTKQKARWLLQVAREQIRKNHFDVAEQALAEAKSYNVTWSMFDETPEKMAEFLAASRAKADKKAAEKPDRAADRPDRTAARIEAPRDRRTAKVRLREARAAVAANDLEGADAIVREVRGWGVSYGLFDDTPDKVSAAVFDARRREALRNADLTVRSYYRNLPRAEPAPTPAPSAPPAELEPPRESQPD